jgi:hypothetical protein
MQLARVLGLLVIVGAGCGGDSGASAACTTGTGTGRSCLEYNASGGNLASTFDQIKMACTQSGGTASNSCSHDGADGGCRMTQVQGGASVSVSFWYYNGMAANEMQACVNAGNTWIAP